MKKLLDVGCGPGTITNTGYYKNFSYSYRIYGIDISQNNIATIQKRWPSGIFQVADAEHIPFPSNFFDQVVCRHVLEHVKEIDQVVHEIYRVCKQNGEVLIAVPTVVFEKAMVKLIPHYMKGGHHERIIQPQALEEKLRRSEFIVLHRSYSKWPMFVLIIFLAVVGRFTNQISMEFQTGVFQISRKNYLHTVFPSSLLSRSITSLLDFLNVIFWFLNYIIPWEVEIVARKKTK